MNIKFSLSLVILAVVIITLFASNAENENIEWSIPEVEFPENNPLTDASINYGSSLFFETLLSKDHTISCQSCHLRREAFADHLPLGTGIENRTVTRNTPSLLNIGLHPHLMKDGKFKTLEDQVLGPILNHNEFDLTPEEVEQRISNIPFYQDLSQAAYGEPVSIENIQKALANFQRILIADKSPFDDFMKGDKNTINESAKRGWELFQSDELNCIQCHSGFDFTDYSFQNNGLYQTFQDSGRALITLNQNDIGKFKIPSLRNIAITTPYMHDGSIDNLYEVISHYANGGQNHENQSELINGFSINETETQDLVTFLESLTDSIFLYQ